jgi:hypothetical protein
MSLPKGAFTMSTLDDLLQQQADLFAKIQAEKASGRATALASVLKIIRDYELTAEDLKDVISLPVSRAKSQNAALKDQGLGQKKRGRPPKIRPDITT